MTQASRAYFNSPPRAEQLAVSVYIANGVAYYTTHRGGGINHVVLVSVETDHAEIAATCRKRGWEIMQGYNFPQIFDEPNATIRLIEPNEKNPALTGALHVELIFSSPEKELANLKVPYHQRKHPNPTHVIVRRDWTGNAR